MGQRARGFTLIEILVVVLIIGILVAVGMPQYIKSFEKAKADDAYGLTMSIAAANRMFALDHSGVTLTGKLSQAACATGASAACASETNACGLMWCGYMARQDLTQKPYTFCAGNDGADCGALCAAGTVACSSRLSSASTPYSGWGYAVNSAGVVTLYDNTTMPPTP